MVFQQLDKEYINQSSNQQLESFSITQMLAQLIPYLYSILGSVSFIIMQVFFKMLTMVLPQSVVLSTQAFFLLLLNSFILVSDERYKQTWIKYGDKKQLDIKGQLNDDSEIQLQQQQNDKRFEINIKDPQVFMMLLKRLCINCMGVMVLSMALQKVPLSIANSLFNTGPIMIFFVQAYFYSKPLSKIHLLLTIVSFIGVLIIVNPFNAFVLQSREEFLNLLLPLLAAVISSLGFIFLHDLKGKLNQFVMLEYTYISQVLYFNFLTNFSAHQQLIVQSSDQPSRGYFEPSITDPYCICAFALSILLAYLANYCRVKSLFLLPPSKVVPLNYIGIVLSLFIDLTVFGHETDLIQVLGILLTSVGLLSHLVLELMENKENQRTEAKKLTMTNKKVNKVRRTYEKSDHCQERSKIIFHTKYPWRLFLLIYFSCVNLLLQNCSITNYKRLNQLTIFQKDYPFKFKIMLAELVPYLYSIFGSVSFIFMQIFFKMLTTVIPQTVVTSVQVFFLLLFNSILLILNQQYHNTYGKYRNLPEGMDLHEVQDDKRFEIHIRDPVVFKLILKRLAINCLGVYLFNTGLQYVPLSIANSLFNTGPIMVFFIEAYFYKKPLSKVHLLLTLVSFIGVVIIVNPFTAFQEEKLSECLTMLIPLLTAVVSSFGFVFLHDLKGKVHQLIMMEYSYISLVLYFNFLINFSADDTIILQNGLPPHHYFDASILDPYCVGAFALNIMCAYMANYCRVKSLFLLPPSKIIPFNYVGIVLSLVVDLVMFGHETSIGEVVGILLTSVGLVANLVLDLSEDTHHKRSDGKEIMKVLQDNIENSGMTRSNQLNPECQQLQQKAYRRLQ